MEPDELLARLKEFEGREIAAAVPGRDPVNQPQIRHWCDAVEDGNPVYTDPDFAAKSVHGGIVAPPTMLQAWTMPGLRPAAERAMGIRPSGPQAALFRLLDEAGFTSVVATNCTQEYARYLRPGDEVRVTTTIESVSEQKMTGLGAGHFITQRMTYRDGEGEEVAVMRFRILKFEPAARPQPEASAPPAPKRARPAPAITHDNRFFWEGVARGVLLLQRCGGCGKLRHPPGPMCPACRSLDWEPVEASGGGVVYSWVVAHHPPIPPFEYPNPIALVELDEGVRVVSNLRGVAPDAIREGLPVRAVFEELEEGRLFLQFRPADDAGEGGAEKGT